MLLRLIVVGIGVAISIPPMGVTPRLNVDGVTRAIGLELPIVVRLSSHLDLCFLGVGVTNLESLGVSSQVIPTRVSPSVTPPTSIASTSTSLLGVGASFQQLCLLIVGVASILALP